MLMMVFYGELMKLIASISLAAALLMLAPTLSAQAQPNSTVIPSANGATQSTPPGGATNQPAVAKTGKPAAHKAAHPKKKKTSFMHKMRDKAEQQVQKLLGSKQQPKPQ
ncbi:MAG: hypothetical protein ACLPQ0_18025 [Candidatus Binatus sp.]